MKAFLWVTLLVLHLSLTEPSLCLSHPPPLNLVEPDFKVNKDFTFHIHNYANSVSITSTSKGIFFHGDFSKITLSAAASSVHEYRTTRFSFKYPPQHRMAEVNQQIIEMQVQYELTDQKVTKWKHRSLILSISFVVTEYAPEEGFSLGRQINHNIQNGSRIDFSQLLPIVPGLNMLLYKGIHSEFPEDSSVLWLIRRELLLMSPGEFKGLKHQIKSQHFEDSLEYHGLVKKLSDLNEISETQDTQQEVKDAQGAVELTGAELKNAELTDGEGQEDL